MDSPTAQNMRDTLQQGPVAENIKNETAKTSQEFDNLARARVKPETTAATGQELTHYHSMFYSLFSWENPRATAAIFLATVSFIFAARYLHIVRYAFKGAYMILGGKATILLRANGICRANFGPTVSAASELLGRGILGHGIISQMRPRKYRTIPRDALEQALEDVQELINFFVIEAQRVFFAENIYVTIAVSAPCPVRLGLPRRY